MSEIIKSKRIEYIIQESALYETDEFLCGGI